MSGTETGSGYGLLDWLEKRRLAALGGALPEGNVPVASGATDSRPVRP
jgi:hypothetical protein